MTMPKLEVLGAIDKIFHFDQSKDVELLRLMIAYNVLVCHLRWMEHFESEQEDKMLSSVWQISHFPLGLSILKETCDSMRQLLPEIEVAVRKLSSTDDKLVPALDRFKEACGAKDSALYAQIKLIRDIAGFHWKRDDLAKALETAPLNLRSRPLHYACDDFMKNSCYPAAAGLHISVMTGGMSEADFEKLASDLGKLTDDVLLLIQAVCAHRLIAERDAGKVVFKTK